MVASDIRMSRVGGLALSQQLRAGGQDPGGRPGGVPGVPVVAARAVPPRGRPRAAGGVRRVRAGLARADAGDPDRAGGTGGRGAGWLAGRSDVGRIGFERRSPRAALRAGDGRWCGWWVRGIQIRRTRAGSAVGRGGGRSGSTSGCDWRTCRAPPRHGTMVIGCHGESVPPRAKTVSQNPSGVPYCPPLCVNSLFPPSSGKPSNPCCRRSRPSPRVAGPASPTVPPSAASSSPCGRAVPGGGCPKNWAAAAASPASADSVTGNKLASGRSCTNGS